MERNQMAPSDAIRLIRKVNLAAGKHFQPVPHFDILEGPDFVADNYGLPKQLPGVKQLLQAIAEIWHFRKCLGS